MSVPARIVDKLRNYEYEKCGYEGAVNDIYALIQRTAALEEEIEDLRVEAQRARNAADRWRRAYNSAADRARQASGEDA